MSGMKKGLFIIAGCIVLLPVLFVMAPILIPLLLVAGSVIIGLKYPEIKGTIGEGRVNRLLSKLGTDYSIYDDLYVPNEKGGTTQVDHVVTSPFGIFVIETKHYKGWIFGQENQKYWTQVIYKRKERLYNPIWQNYGHVQALKHYLGREDLDSIHSIIAFSQDCTFKFKEDFKSASVIQFPQLAKVIKAWNVRRISAAELQKINRTLEGLLIRDKKEKKQVKKQHVSSIKSNLKENAKKEKKNIQLKQCPKCGGRLSLKKGKYGSFYGCSHFPKCRYTKQIS